MTGGEIPLSVRVATTRNARAIAALRTAAADGLTRRFGRGHWSSGASERGALHAMRRGIVLVAFRRRELVAVLVLARIKPWAIDPSYFTPATRPLYLTDMAVKPSRQGRGVGRWILDRAVEAAREAGGDALRLDAYDAEAGAAGFYARCGFREVGRVVYRTVPLVYFERVLTAEPWPTT